MSRQRLKLALPLTPSALGRSAEIRLVTGADRQQVAELLLAKLARSAIAAYAGTVDDEGETPEQALVEIDRTLGGAYGPFLASCSFVLERNGKLLAASLITHWQKTPLLAFVMVAPHVQRQGIAEQVLRCSMAALWEQGETTLTLFVTAGNTPAQRLYISIGDQHGAIGVFVVQDDRWWERGEIDG